MSNRTGYRLDSSLPRKAIYSLVYLAVAAVPFTAACTSAPDHAVPSATSHTPMTPVSIAISVPPIGAEIDDVSTLRGHDPCTALGDAVVERVGFNPHSRKRSEAVPSGSKFVGCSFEDGQLPSQAAGATKFLNVTSSDLTLEEIRDKMSTTDITISGREAVQYSSSDKVCEIAVERSFGALHVSQSIARSNVDPCAHLREITGEVSAALPD